MKKALLGYAVILGLAPTMGCQTTMTTTSAEPESAVTQNETVASTENNPFFSEYSTFQQVPPFEDVRLEHFLPAFTEGMRRQQQEVADICNNPEPPSFSNTIEAFENSGAMLTNVSHVFSTLAATSSNDAMDALSQQIAPKMTQHYDKIYLNEAFFARVKAVHDQHDKISLASDQRKLLNDLYRHFVQAGATLNAEQKKELEDINQRLSVLEETFSKNVRKDAENYRLVLSEQSQLDGLPEDVINEARAEAIKAGMPEKWVFTIQRSSITPFLTYSSQRDLRKEIYLAYQQCGNNNNEYDNKTVILEILALRNRQAQLLGYPNYASYSLENSMAKTTENVYGLLGKMWPAAIEQARAEEKELQALIAKEGNTFTLEPWDWWYYAEKVRKDKYDLDENMLRPYFSLQGTIDGAFALANKLFGLRFVERHDIPTYHEQVRTFSVFDKDNNLIGLYYLDPFRREGKRSGAWMDTLRPQSRMAGKATLPLIINVLNFNPPATPEGISLLTLDEANTVLHEFGHALHGLLSSVRYASQAGTNVYRDFVEFPSQVMENWLIEPAYLKQYAKHFETGKPIPEDLIKKIQNSKRFNQGFAVTEYMAAAYLDLAWHTVDPAKVEDVEKFERETLKSLGLINTIAPRYHSTYFLHIFTSGYAAGYYSYQWSQILDADTFALFEKKGIFDRETAERYRKTILAKGGSEEAASLFKAFRGRDPQIAALLDRLGFTQSAH